MGRRHKQKRQRDWDDDSVESGRERRKRSRQWHEAQTTKSSPGRVALAEASAKPKQVTCYQCTHLVITRSIVKYLNQPWEGAISFPSLSCFQQKWTLENPDEVPDHAEVSPYLVEEADRCPDFARGYPRDHRW